jgi:hypothetical protein
MWQAAKFAKGLEIFICRFVGQEFLNQAKGLPCVLFHKSTAG